MDEAAQRRLQDLYETHEKRRRTAAWGNDEQATKIAEARVEVIEDIAYVFSVELDKCFKDF